MYKKLLLYNNVEEYKLDENTGCEDDKGGEFVLLSALFAKQLIKGKVAWVQAPQWEKGKKQGTWKKKEKSASGTSRPVDLGRVKGGGDMLSMPPICPPAMNLSLKCHHVKFSSRMTAWAYYVASIKKYLNSRRVRVQAKRSPTGVTPLRRRVIRTFYRKMRRVRPVKNSQIDSFASKKIPQVHSVRHNALLLSFL